MKEDELVSRNATREREREKFEEMERVKGKKLSV